MNCKPGDFAVIVRDEQFVENIGRIVLVTGIATAEEFAEPFEYWGCEPLQAVWGFDSFDREVFDCERVSIGDEDLRPLRDSDGEDEMLRIAGKPQEVLA